tara:strand:+ start:25 stop:285 length:261 start_codon:yes stop_codon:yes gene_type:complete
MLVDPTEGLTGTIGGGCGEAEVIESAYRVLKTGFAERVRVDLTEDFTTWSPAVCGGVMDVFVEPVEMQTGDQEQLSEESRTRAPDR